MSGLIPALAASFAVALAIENGRPSVASFRAPPVALLLRIALHAALFAAAFALSWRPWHAGFAAAAVAGLFGAGNAMKSRILGEPLVFTDFALVRLAIRHPRLYYADRLAEPRWLALFAALAAATVAWFAIEPSILPPGRPAWLVAPPIVTAAIALAFRTRSASDAARAVIGARPDAQADAARLGLGASMLLGWLVWRRQPRPSDEARAAAMGSPALRRAETGAPLIVAIQCESFVDIAARGLRGPALPGYRGLAARSLAWGRCRVPADGAYTMRSEFGFLTGLPPETLGFDAFDPLLRVEAYAPFSIGRRFAAAGWRTVLVHPYDGRFFERDRLAPLFGFERFVDGAAFEGAERFGPYVSDAALAVRLEAEIAAACGPAFLFAVTMENHGPWGPGRIEGEDDPAAQYARHLENADAMLSRVARALAARPGGGVLCVYGDHAPARILHPDLPDRGETDYVLWDSRKPPAAPPVRRDLGVDALARLLVSAA